MAGFCRTPRAIARAIAGALAWISFAALAADEATPAADAAPQAPAISRLRLSGFATIGVVDSRMDAPWVFRRDSLQPGGPHGGLRSRVDSRLGLQANLALTERLDAVVQTVLKPMPEAAPESQRIEWALLAYRPAPDWTLRAGRVSTDMRLVSDYTNVGFAYPWVRPIPEMYGLLSISSVDGVDVQKAWTGGAARWRAKLQLGQTDMRAPMVGGEALTVKGRDMLALTLQREEGGLLLKANVAWTQIAFDAGLGVRPLSDALARLRQLPEPSVSRQASALASRLPVEPLSARYASVGLQYQSGPWLTHAELALSDVRETGDSDVSAYASVGYRFGAVTVFGMAGAVSPRQRAAQAPTTWTAALTPLLGAADAAAAQGAGEAAATVGNALRIDQRSLSLGMRWDVHPQVALKAQIDHVRVGANGAALWWRGTPDARSGNVLSFVVDTVF
jgi:hypothetical protein